MWGVAASAEEIGAALPGDDIVAHPDVVMDRAFSLAAPPDVVWPWFVQLGKRRAGWYLPRRVEWFVPRSRRAIRFIDPAQQGLAVGDVIPDWGGREATFELVTVDPPSTLVDPPSTLVHRSTRGSMNLSWTVVLRPAGVNGTRVQLRLRLGPVRRRRLAEFGGGAIDLVTIAGLAAGLRERIEAQPAD